MPILTKNETPTKGQKAEFQLDKAELAALPSVVADSYFSDTANWKQVELIYASTLVRQRRIVKFDATQATPIGYFFASLKAENDFQIQQIVINDFDGDELKIARSELAVAEFDIIFSSLVWLLEYTSGSLTSGGFVNEPPYTLVQPISGVSGAMLNSVTFKMGNSQAPMGYYYLALLDTNFQELTTSTSISALDMQSAITDRIFYFSDVALTSDSYLIEIRTQGIPTGAGVEILQFVPESFTGLEVKLLENGALVNIGLSWMTYIKLQ